LDTQFRQLAITKLLVKNNTKGTSIMSTAEERIQILKMIEEGKISASEGAELIRALDQNSQETKDPLKGASQPRWFRVRVTDVANGRHKVNINIPIGLVNVGMKMGARFTSDIEGFSYEEIGEAIRLGRQGKIVDYTNKKENERVEIFIE
jgi:hypothetical protein